MPLETIKVALALSNASHRACERRDWATAHAIAHVEADLFGYDPGCPKQPCPFA